MSKLGNPITNLGRCPHCGVAEPNIYPLFIHPAPVPRGDGGPPLKWGMYACATCGHALLAQALGSDAQSRSDIVRVIPRGRSAHADLPAMARRFLDQAYQTLQSPDAAAVMAGSAVDAMLKEIGYLDGSVYSRIDQALKDNRITEGMAEWAHVVRLGANRPRHADLADPHVTSDEAAQSVDFAEALGHFLFVLTARISRGIEKAIDISR